MRLIAGAVRLAIPLGVALSLGFTLAGATHGQATPMGLEVDGCDGGGVDSDSDGLADRCELMLAHAFAPVLVVTTGGCNWDDSLAPARPGGGYLFAAGPAGEGRVRLAYLPAYYRDCGWSGVKCWLPFVDCSAHSGDSELIVVEIEPDSAGDGWTTVGVFLSAHCFGRSGSSCRWYRDDALDRFEWRDARLGAPIVWVSEGRQANYPTRAACDRGHHRLDTCDRSDSAMHFPIVSAAQNIGSPTHPHPDDGCIRVRAIWPSDLESPARVECVWTAERFNGWQRDGDGVTGYSRYLRDIVGFR